MKCYTAIEPSKESGKQKGMDMPKETFEIGDRVYLTPSKHFGIIVKVNTQGPFRQPQAAEVRSYNIKLDDGATITAVFRGIERVPS